MSLSARANKDSCTVTPIALAVLRLITNSNLVAYFSRPRMSAANEANLFCADRLIARRLPSVLFLPQVRSGWTCVLRRPLPCWIVAADPGHMPEVQLLRIQRLLDLSGAWPESATSVEAACSRNRCRTRCQTSSLNTAAARHVRNSA
jgi:hypothetical protein